MARQVWSITLLIQQCPNSPKTPIEQWAPIHPMTLFTNDRIQQMTIHQYAHLWMTPFTNDTFNNELIHQRPHSGNDPS